MRNSETWIQLGEDICECIFAKDENWERNFWLFASQLQLAPKKRYLFPGMLFGLFQRCSGFHPRCFFFFFFFLRKHCFFFKILKIWFPLKYWSLEDTNIFFLNLWLHRLYGNLFACNRVSFRNWTRNKPKSFGPVG